MSSDYLKTIDIAKGSQSPRKRRRRQRSAGALHIRARHFRIYETAHRCHSKVALRIFRAKVGASMIGTVEIFVGMLLAVTVLAWLARRLHIAYPILFVIGGLLLGLIPGVPRHQPESRIGFPILPASVALSGSLVHFLAGFPRQSPAHLHARRRTRPSHHSCDCISGPSIS